MLRSPRTSRRLVLSSLAIVGISCSSSSSSSSFPTLVEGTIGAAGGTVVVPGEPTSLTVPAGALATDTNIRITLALHSIVPGWVDVGPTYEISPIRTTFSAPSQLVLLFDPDSMSSAVVDSDVRIGFRNSSGQISVIVPTQVDRAQNLVRCDVTELGVFWVVAPDIVSAAALWPLNHGDTYRFDSRMVITVEHTSIEPNFSPRTVIKVTLTRTGRTSGYYFDTNGGQLLLLGTFEITDQQILTASPVLLIDRRDAIGTIRPVTGTILGFVPYGSSNVGFQGLSRTTTNLAERQDLTLGLGIFHTVRVPVRNELSVGGGLVDTSDIQFWLAEDVGPVQIRFGTSNVTRLVSGTVAGEPIMGH